jgi:protein-S-isoprenylcysteine O-methyltransferase Ste14
MNPDDVKARVLAVLGSGIFLVIVPGTVAGYIPWRICRWHAHTAFFGFAVFRGIGGLLIAVGVVLLLEAFLRFALQGVGTPAPILPPKHLVIGGSYRHVRNPMYCAVVALILGQGLLFGDSGVLLYGLCVWFFCHLFVVFYEEPALRKKFPGDYAIFSANVPRWIPRLTPWKEGA